jgi:4a-hydroxytetrahydrobiopterin dehydratase
MKNHPIPDGWERGENSLQKCFTFDSFVLAMVFVNTVAELAEQQNHHPDITINYRSVTLVLTTHDAGCLTEKDYALAAGINELPV